jgi:DNA polymerase
LDRCPKCPGKHNCVGPDGSDQCNGYALIGEAPGYDEDKKGKPFVGKTGREMRQGYIPLTNLNPLNFRIDNAISCLPDRPKGKLDIKRQADRDLLYSCAEHHLYLDLERLSPRIIIPMGAFACHAIDINIDLDLQHGIPIQTSWGNTFPMWHPSGGIHEPKKMLQIRTDWIRLRKYLTGVLHVQQDQYKGKEVYKALSLAQEVLEVLDGWEHLPLACDTEVAKGGKPFCITFSVQPGSGFLIRAEDTSLLLALQQKLDCWKGPILFHNWLFDGGVVARMGLRFPIKKIRDTMVQAFHLGNLPQGLKALAYRELGMSMQDFDDLVTPHAIPHVLDYYRQMNAEEWPKPEAELIRVEGGGYKLYKAQSLNTKIKAFWKAWAKKEGDKDVFSPWTDNWKDSHQMVEDELGPWPGKCISYAPFDQIVHYACRDADATLRLWPLLKHMRQRVRRCQQEDWTDGWAA